MICRHRCCNLPPPLINKRNDHLQIFLFVSPDQGIQFVPPLPRPLRRRSRDPGLRHRARQHPPAFAEGHGPYLLQAFVDGRGRIRESEVIRAPQNDRPIVRCTPAFGQEFRLDTAQEAGVGRSHIHDIARGAVDVGFDVQRGKSARQDGGQGFGVRMGDGAPGRVARREGVAETEDAEGAFRF